MKLPKKARALLHALAYSITFTTLAVIFLISMYIFEYFTCLLNIDFTLNRIIFVFLWTVGVVFFSALMVDIAGYIRDKKICTLESIDYKIFIVLNKGDKQEIYRKYSK